ncbi:MAG: hypothetical protein KF685_06815 [Acidobacteria bacterium]|nr:hypothetical protein [Acidobacteriota bacterium]
MGLDINGTKFLLYSRNRGVSFAETATVGRQSMLIGEDALAGVLAKAGEKDAASKASEFTGANGYAEPFLRSLGAESIVSFDASDYEGATVVSDLNLPIGDEHKERFSVVLDGGTLEHVFNYPQAIKNCMEMVRPGGHFLSITPTNNHLGHGFYQFSPELFFRIFSGANGFELEQTLIFEEIQDCDWYEVTDPDTVHERVTLVNEEPTMLLIIAKRIEVKPIFEKPPQQSDYFAIWSTHEKGEAAGVAGIDNSKKKGITRLVYGAWKKIQRGVNRRFGILGSREKHFKKIDPFS